MLREKENSSRDGLHKSEEKMKSLIVELSKLRKEYVWYVRSIFFNQKLIETTTVKQYREVARTHWVKRNITQIIIVKKNKPNYQTLYNVTYMPCVL